MPKLSIAVERSGIVSEDLIVDCCISLQVEGELE
jgi:hypothetical protein